MGAVDKAYFVEFGARLRAFRKAKGITQVEMAEILGFSQSQVHAFEAGKRRPPISVLPTLAEILDVSFEELLASDPTKAKKPKKRGPPSKLETQLQKLAELPRSKRRVVSEMLDMVLKQAS